MEHLMAIPDGIERVLLSEEVIAARVAEMAAQISADYEDDDELVLVGVLKGAFILLADVSRRLAVRHHVDFIALASYEGSERSGNVRLIMDTRNDLSGRHVLIVEDILDTGHTLDYLTQVFNARHPASLKTCVMLRKKEREEVAVHVDYLGFDIGDEWVVGYGLDYADKYRTLPYIAAIRREKFQK
jgi:hypoxanthine phosphoribosyltransferase